MRENWDLLELLSRNEVTTGETRGGVRGERVTTIKRL